MYVTICSGPTWLGQGSTTHNSYTWDRVSGILLQLFPNSEKTHQDITAVSVCFVQSNLLHYVCMNVCMYVYSMYVSMHRMRMYFSYVCIQIFVKLTITAN